MALVGLAVSEKKIFEIVDRRTDGRTDDGRTPDHGHPISSPCEPSGSGELKMCISDDAADIVLLKKTFFIDKSLLVFMLSYADYGSYCF